MTFHSWKIRVFFAGINRFKHTNNKYQNIYRNFLKLLNSLLSTIVSNLAGLSVSNPVEKL